MKINCREGEMKGEIKKLGSDSEKNKESGIKGFKHRNIERENEERKERE
jgi:hypothetical protein